MEIYMPPVVQPRGLMEYANEASNFKNSQQQNQLNNLKLQYAPQQMEMERQTNQAQLENNQLSQDVTKHKLFRDIATEIVGKVKSTGLSEDDPQFNNAFQQISQPYAPIVAKLAGHQYDPSQPVDYQSVKQLAGPTAQEKAMAEIQNKLIEKQLLNPYEHDYVPMQTPSGNVEFYDKKHPNAGGVSAQPMQMQPQAQANGMQAPQPMAQAPNGLVNIFAQQGQNVSPKTAQLQQEEAVKLGSMAQEEDIKRQAELNKSDLALMQSEPQKIAGLNESAMNLAGLGENLNKYGEQVKKDILPTDNSIAYNARQILGSNTILNDITQANGQIMIETMRSMKQDAGVSPSQLMNTEKEWERQLAAATGQGTVESRKHAWDKLTRQLHQTYNSYEKTREEAYKRQRKEYKPLINQNILPGRNIVDADTGDAPIGTVSKLNGQNIRVIGQNQVEVIE